MAARLCDAAGPFEVLMPTMQIERLPAGVTANAHERGRAARLPRSDRGGRARWPARARSQHRHRRTVDSQSRSRDPSAPSFPTPVSTAPRFARRPRSARRSRRDRAADHPRLVVVAAEGRSVRRRRGRVVRRVCCSRRPRLGIDLQFTLLEREVPTVVRQRRRVRRRSIRRALVAALGGGRVGHASAMPSPAGFRSTIRWPSPID